MNHVTIRTFSLSCLVALLIGSGACTAGEYQFDAAQETFLNPERGLYGNGPLVQRTSFTKMRESGVSLVYAPIFLEEFREKKVSDERLGEISAAFDRLREAGLKAIVRISYSNRIGRPDAPLTRVEEHLGQLAPLFKKHQDVIAFFQAGIIGAWGEWHASTNGLDTPDGRRSVLRLLLKHVPENEFIQVRTPAFKWKFFDDVVVTADKAFTSADVARVGHHNDCFLADETDMGTYPRDKVELWKDRLAVDTLYTPMGGETCRVSDLTKCDNFQAELERLHWTYLNRDYQRAVIRELEPCWKTITNRLGYRYELVSCELPDEIRPGADFHYVVRLKNVGYAPLYKRRPVFLKILREGAFPADIELPDIDPRHWAPGKTVEIKGRAKVPEALKAPSGWFALWIPDQFPELRSRAEYSIRFANKDVWDAKAGCNNLTPLLPIRK
jgi:hypothetical protein